MIVSRVFNAVKVFLFALLVICVAGLVFVWAVCFSPRLMQRVIMLGANAFLKELVLRDLAIENQACRFPENFKFQNVSMVLSRASKEYEFHVEKIGISNMLGLFFSGDWAEIHFKNVSVKSPAFRLDGLEAELVCLTAAQCQGSVSVREAESKGCVVTETRAQVAVQSGKVTVSHLTADAYKGKVSGNAFFDFASPARYTADLVFDVLDAAQMEQMNRALFSQMRDRISGTIRVQGSAGRVEHVEMDVRLNKDGQIQAGLLKPLLAYIPKSVQKENLAQAIQGNRRVRLNDARLKLADQNFETVCAEIQLKSDELNLDVNLSVDIISEGGMHGLFNNFASLSQLLKGQ